MLANLLCKIFSHAGQSAEPHRYDLSVSAMRKREYPMLHGITYLDHAGTTLPSVSLIDAFSEQQKKLLLANPHSALAEFPSISQTLTEETRRKVLELFNASPEHFEVIFVANATAAMKLVFDAFRDHDPGFDYYYHRDSHTSLVGGRELASQHSCFGIDEVDGTTEWWPNQQSQSSRRPRLFAYPAQSNMNGRRLPLSWPALMRKEENKQNTYVLLDVAAYVSTTPIDLSNHKTAPDFLSMSFYKIFGFPNLGALVVRKAAAHVFDKRRYFGGGTTDMITCNEDPWVAKKKGLSERLEDGTGPAHSILALSCAIDVYKRLYGGMAQVSRHTSWLALQLYKELLAIRHTNGQPVCVIYKNPESTYGDPISQGPTVAFNVCAPDGRWFDTALVSNEAMVCKIHLRAGGMCNPAGMAHALGFSDNELRQFYTAGMRCGEGDHWKGMPLGMVRASFGACSTLEDVRVLVSFIRDHFIDRYRRDSGTKLPQQRKATSVLRSLPHPMSWIAMTRCCSGREKHTRRELVSKKWET
ncbi:PLP-dependent transferase [Bimuria novae-zelandiae CBS 107.79]|uniref:PLP-dependent transferase n=1 Tax=Bimuria novae-zelandiae CBS 107.79 TaxID=1447943 RepID=A0A6A5VQI8_9PLEO|nr:PLP-dependent transferase [Bimuria novae-zelandiae CBS 107.79]